MKNLSFSLFLLLSLLFFHAHVSEAVFSCNVVNGMAAPCVKFGLGKVPKPPAACCSGLQQIAKMAMTVPTRQAVCRCLKQGMKNYPGMQEKYLSKMPGSCKVNIGFPVSMNMNCNAIH